MLDYHCLVDHHRGLEENRPCGGWTGGKTPGFVWAHERGVMLVAANNMRIHTSGGATVAHQCMLNWILFCILPASS